MLGWLKYCKPGYSVTAALCPQVFTLPKVSAKLKLKLTALEGSRVRRVSVAHFGSCRAEDYGEHHLAVLTNLGDIQVVSLPLLKPQVRYSCIRREDVSGIASCVFTKYGQGVQVAAHPGPLQTGLGVGLPMHCRALLGGAAGAVVATARHFGWVTSRETLASAPLGGRPIVGRPDWPHPLGFSSAPQVST